MAEKQVVVERSSGGTGVGLVMVALAIILAVILGYMFLQNDTKETNAVTGAAQSVGAAADSVGDAVKPKN